MQLRIEPTLDETIRSCQALAAVSWSQGRATAIFAGVYALVGIGAVQFARPTAPVTILLALGGFVLAVTATQLEAKQRLRRLYAADPHVEEPHFVQVDEEGIRAWCDHVDTRMRWDAITAVTETTEFYLFIRGPGAGPTIPKRVLDAQADAELRELVRAYSPDRGRSLARRPDESLAAPAT